MKLLVEKSFLFFIATCFIVSVDSCKKDELEPEVITETKYETVHDTIRDTINVTDTLNSVDTLLINTPPDTVTTFILVRHCETLAGTNPNLSASGLARVEQLKRVLQNVSVDAIFSTNYNRTLQTADSIAKERSLPVLLYDPNKLEAFVDENIAKYKGKIILVVGHSNTTPQLLNILTGSSSFVNIPETEYDNLYFAAVSKKGNAEIKHLKFGN